MNSKRTIVSLIVVALICLSLLVGCVGRALTAATNSTDELRLQVTDLKSRLEAAQEELDSYRLREQNWDYWQKVNAFLLKTLAGVSQTRELSPPEHVEFRVVTVDWAKKKWGDDYVRENARKIEIDERIYKGLFVLPDTASLASLYTAWPGSYLAAAMGDRVYFIQENIGTLGGEEIRKVLSHEVVHLIQSSHFETPEHPTYDQDKAWSGLTEGDADFTRAMYLAQLAGEKPPDFGKLYGAPGAKQEPERPMAFTRLLYFPYDYGQDFISALYRKGGWQQVNEAFKKPPETTQQVMHPEKYLAGKGPENINPLPLNIQGWKQERADRLGEHFIKSMLETWIPGPQAAAAAGGWAGDRLTYYEREQASLFTWQTLWDSGESAALFYQAFLALLDKVGATQLTPGLWQGGGEYLSVGRPDSRGVLIIVSKDKGMIDAAIGAVPARR